MDWILRNAAVLMIFLGGLIAACGAVFAELRATGATTKFKKISPIVILSGALMGVIGTFWANYQQDEVLKFLSGADTYGFLMVGTTTSTTIDYVLFDDGEAPFYDVMIVVADANEWRDQWLKKGFPGQALDPNSGWKGGDSIASDDLIEMYQMYRKTLVTIPVGTVGPNQARLVWTAPAPRTTDQKYDISLLARNGLITQELLLHRTKEGWTWATKVWRTSPFVKNGKQPKQALKEIIRPDFPRDKVDWK